MENGKWPIDFSDKSTRSPATVYISEFEIQFSDKEGNYREESFCHGATCRGINHARAH